MPSVNDVLARLRSKANPEQLPGMTRYDIAVQGRLGVPVPDMRKLAREIGRDRRLALDLSRTGTAEAEGQMDETVDVRERARVVRAATSRLAGYSGVDLKLRT